MAKYRLGFVADQDPRDRLGWSGTNFGMFTALTNCGWEIIPIFDIPQRRSAWRFVRMGLYRMFEKGYYSDARSRLVLNAYAHHIRSKCAELKLDGIFATGTHLVAHVGPEVRTFIWADATVPRLFASYPGYAESSRRFYREAVESECAAVTNRCVCIFSSEWAATSAVNELGALPGQVHVVPFGANFIAEPSSREVTNAIAARNLDCVNLLFIGVDWIRKGGSKAIEIAASLAKTGRRTCLKIVGVPVIPNLAKKLYPNLTIEWVGQISKVTAEGERQIQALLATTHLLILPTVADCTPMVIAEANAFGVPVFTHAVGGITTQIRNGINGFAFELSSAPTEIAVRAAELLYSPTAYADLCRSARARYESELSWSAATGRISNIVETCLRSKE